MYVHVYTCSCMFIHIYIQALLCAGAVFMCVHFSRKGVNSFYKDDVNPSDGDKMECVV